MTNFNLPKSWNEVSLQQFIDIKETAELDSSEFYKAIEMVAILSGKEMDDDDIEDMDINEFSVKLAELKWFSQQPPLDFKRVLSDLKCKDVNTLTLGEFIDLEHFFGEDYITNLPMICAILYRKTKQDEWGNEIIEPYDNINIEERSKLFKEIPIGYNYGVIDYYIKFKKNFYDAYRNIFQPQDDDGEMLEEDMEDPDVQAEIRAEKVLEKWNWERILFSLSNGDITKYDEVTKLPLIFVFNHLSFKKEMKL